MSNSSERTRVLWVAKGLGTGGMERLLVTHARLGDRTRFDYQAAYIVDRENSVIDELSELGVPSLHLDANETGPLGWMRSLRRVVKQQEIDVVHFHSPMVAGLGRLAILPLRHRPRSVYTEHNAWPSYVLPTRLANAATYRLDRAQIAVSGAAYESVPKLLSSRLEVLTHGIDTSALLERSAGSNLREELAIPEHHRVCLTVANLRVQKAYDVLLEAAKLITDDLDDVTFVSVGQGPLADELEQKKAELGLDDRFRFLGHRPDIPELLGTADLFVLSSRDEGLPLALMEAMAVGLTPVVTTVGGIPDYVTNNESGLLVQPESAEDLRAAITTALGAPDLRSRLGKRAAEVAKAFDASQAVNRIEQIYTEAVA